MHVAHHMAQSGRGSILSELISHSPDDPVGIVIAGGTSSTNMGDVAPVQIFNNLKTDFYSDEPAEGKALV